MSLTIGIYDFFAYTIPGAFYLMVAAYAAALFGKVQVDVAQVNDLSLLSALILAGVAFVAGFLIDPLTKPWVKLFRKRDPTVAGYQSYLKNCSTFKATFVADDWRIMINCVRFRSRETADRSERFNALNIMLRNVGFGLLLLAGVYVLYFLLIAANFWNLALAAACLWLSVVAEQESAKYSKWFYSSIFQAAAALSLDDHCWVEPLTVPEPLAAATVQVQHEGADVETR